MYMSCTFTADNPESGLFKSLFPCQIEKLPEIFLSMEGGRYSAQRDNNKLVILAMLLRYRSHPPQEPGSMW